MHSTVDSQSEDESSRPSTPPMGSSAKRQTAKRVSLEDSEDGDSEDGNADRGVEEDEESEENEEDNIAAKKDKVRSSGRQ